MSYGRFFLTTMHHMIYTIIMERGTHMPALDTIMTTKVFMNGRSQVVHIPIEYRFEEDEVFINWQYAYVDPQVISHKYFKTRGSNGF